MEPNNLFYLAGQCLTLDEFPFLGGSICDAFSSGEVNPDDFIYYCDAHLVLTSVWRKFTGHGLSCLFSTELNEHLNDMYSLNKHRNTAILRQIDDVSAALNQKGIVPVYMKGAAHLLDGLYDDDGERLMGDIDLLVKRKDYFTAVRLLLDSGYENKNLKLYDEVPGGKHFPRLSRDDVPADVEIHHLPVKQQFSKQFTPEMVYREKKEIAGKENCFVTCDVHKIVHNFIHSQLSNSGHRFKITALRDIYDLYRLSKRTELEKALEQIEKKEKARGYFLFADTALGLDNRFYNKGNINAKLHCFLSDGALKYPRLSGCYVKALKLFNLVFNRYLGRLIKAVFHKPSRDYIIKRVKNPCWRREHFEMLKKTYLR